MSRIGSKLVQIGWSANPPQFTDIGHRLAIFTNPCPILIRLDWTITIRFKKSGVLYIRVTRAYTRSEVPLRCTDLHRLVFTSKNPHSRPRGTCCSRHCPLVPSNVPGSTSSELAIIFPPLLSWGKHIQWKVRVDLVLYLAGHWFSDCRWILGGLRIVLGF